MAARLMREILVDHARKKHARKRGGDITIVALDEAFPEPRESPVDVLALDEALTELTALDPRLCRVVELKFFAGLTIDETALRSMSRRRRSNAIGPSPRPGSTSGCRPRKGERAHHRTVTRGPDMLPIAAIMLMVELYPDVSIEAVAA